MQSVLDKLPRTESLLLHRIRLNRGSQWEVAGEGLSLVLAKGGRGTCNCGESTVILRPGDLMVRQTQPPLRLAAANKDGFACDVFGLLWSHLAPLFGTSELWLRRQFRQECGGHLFFGAGSAVARQCHQLLGELRPQRTVEQRSLLLRVAALALAEPLETGLAPANGLNGQQELFAHRLQDLPGDSLLRLSATEAARHFACTPRHLNRLFHRYLGSSFAELRLELRLRKALALLGNPESKVIWVAQQSGFNQLRLFNRQFKRRFGQTPTQWRRRNGFAAGPSAPRSSGSGGQKAARPSLPPFNEVAAAAGPNGNSAGGLEGLWRALPGPTAKRVAPSVGAGAGAQEDQPGKIICRS